MRIGGVCKESCLLSSDLLKSSTAMQGGSAHLNYLLYTWIMQKKAWLNYLLQLAYPKYTVEEF